MANFEPAFQKMIQNEGGFVLHEVKGDTGGMTYAGVARNSWKDWPGWKLIDRGDTDNPELTGMVRDFYKEHFWNPIRADGIDEQAVADTLFGFSVNAGRKTAVRIAQAVVGSIQDGAIGPKTIAAINDADVDLFLARYAIGRVARYAAICNKNRSQSKFLLGWVNRTLRTL